MTEHTQSTRNTNRVLAACAVVLTLVVLRREFRTTITQPPPFPDVQQLEKWRTLLTTGHRLGSQTAKVEVIVFGDFECPVCGGFSRTSLRGILADFPNDVAYTFHHWPLSYHRFAYPAARASECAAAQGRFAEFHDLLYRLQDSLGLKSFHDFARMSGVGDLDAFGRCASDILPVPVIEADRRFADSLHLAGTPALIIDGALYKYAPDSAVLHEIIANKVLGARKR